jgi:AcrR family transcriptional regulator
MRNAKATRERILEAATTEFAAHGVAGARVDRIAQAAECNKNLIYIYFESKEALFAAVLQKHLGSVYEKVAFTSDDLPAYAGHVFDFAMTHPDLMRLMSWFALERKVENPTGRRAVFQGKVEALAQSQKVGAVNDAFTPGFLVTMIMALATAWTPTNPFGPSLDPEAAAHPEKLRKDIMTAIRMLTSTKASKA